MSNDDRRINMYFSEKKYIDDTIYQYFKDIPNKQDIIKMVLYQYVTGKNITSNNFVTSNTQKSERTVTKASHKTHKNVTENAPVNNEIITKNTQKAHKTSTKDAPISDNFNDFITEEEVKEIKENEDKFDILACMNSMNQFMK